MVAMPARLGPAVNARPDPFLQPCALDSSQHLPVIHVVHWNLHRQAWQHLVQPSTRAPAPASFRARQTAAVTGMHGSVLAIHLCMSVVLSWPSGPDMRSMQIRVQGLGLTLTLN